MLREPGLSAERDALQASPEQQESVLRALGVPRTRCRAARRRPPRVPVLLSGRACRRTGLGPGRRSAPDRAAGARRRGARPETACAAPPPRPGQAALVSQPDFDRLLWCADLNFVRGEDSFVRAAWAARPLVWQIYPQHDQVHLDKLEAWLARYPATEGAGADPPGTSPTAPKPLVRPCRRPGARGLAGLGPPPVTGTQPRPTGPTWRKIWPRFAQSWPRNARIESFLRSPDAIGPQNTDASRAQDRKPA